MDVNHNVSVISMIVSKSPRLRFEVNLNDYNINLSRKLRKMGFTHIGRGTYVKELRDVDEMKQRYEFNMEFLNREFGKKNVHIFKYTPVAS
jgi:hypothetical protein